MNQEKVGKFISQLRKNKNLTQSQLAEKLGISDRAISKWERGLNLPDASLMLKLADIFEISVNELLSGEFLKNDEYINKAEKNLIELRTINYNYSKLLLNLEIILGTGSSIIFILLIFIIPYMQIDLVFKIIYILLAIVFFAAGMISCLKIEQVAGYYECSKCHNTYVPAFKQILFSTHVGRTRKLKCPKCGCKSWSKKVLDK